MIDENESLISVHFDSISELLSTNDIHRTNLKWVSDLKSGVGRGEPPENWYGNYHTNSRSVIDSGITGCDKMYKLLKQMISTLDKETGSCTLDKQEVIQKVKRVRIVGDFGDEIDIHKVYSGNCDTAWSSRIRKEIDVKHRMVTLFIDIGGASNEDANDSLWRAAIAVKLQRDLEVAGKAVKLVIGGLSNNTITHLNKKLTTSIVIKHYDEKLSLERTAAMCNLGFCRAANFIALMAHNYPVNMGLGQPLNLSDDKLPIRMQNEVDAGHTKCTIVGRASSLRSALVELNNCYDMLDSMRNAV